MKYKETKCDKYSELEGNNCSSYVDAESCEICCPNPRPTMKEYLASIGRKGGEKSKRKLSPEAQAKMQAGRKKPKATIEQKKG